MPKKPSWPNFMKEPKDYHTHNLRQMVDKAQDYLEYILDNVSSSHYERLTEALDPYTIELEKREEALKSKRKK